MDRREGQVLVLFGLLTFVLLGLLGLAIDGGYYFASSRLVSMAADSAARASAVAVTMAQSDPNNVGLYSAATSNGLAVGQENLRSSPLSGITMTIEYNDSMGATPTGGGWYAGPPGGTTAAVRSTVTGTYNTLFLPVVGVRSLPIRRLGQGGTLTPVVALPHVMPLSVCSTTILLSPNGPWTIWSQSSSLNLCLVLGWTGLTNLDNRSPITCADYQQQVGPPVQGPVPSVGSNVGVDTRLCNNFGQWTAGLNGTTQVIPEITPPLLGLLAAQVVACRQVVLQTSSTTVTATPSGGQVPCSIHQTY